MQNNQLYTEDILKDGFEQRTIWLENDAEGLLKATLVRHLCSVRSHRAVLYIHGFNDYFFQSQMALQFNAHSYNFYALDLRKYGRSYMPHQTFNDIRNLKDYYQEIKKALEIIKQEGNTRVLLMGHSTGGLVVTLFAKDHPTSNLFAGVILNSPFYELNQPYLVKLFMPLIASLGKVFPSLKIDAGLSEEYGKSLHRDYYGEWDYFQEWKPNKTPPVHLGWIRAIYQGQKELKAPFAISQPVLVMHSTASTNRFNDRMEMHTKDAVLNVKDIHRIAQNIEGEVQIVAIDDGMHDLVLSNKLTRYEVYNTISGWIKEHEI